MIRSREKLKFAVILLLVVQNSVFADEGLQCVEGMVIGVEGGYNEQFKPEVKPCPVGNACVRLEVEEMQNPDRDPGQLTFFLELKN